MSGRHTECDRRSGFSGHHSLCGDGKYGVNGDAGREKFHRGSRVRGDELASARPRAMCGIAGIVDLAGRPVDCALVRKLCAELSHRGPDDEGYYVDRQVTLGQRRLAILDVAGGRQPMSNEDKSVWVTFNGEIYNFQELRQDLEKLGYRFATRSDTEVIVHAYKAYGTDCVKHFRGMFAFALWDQHAQTLFLARDRVGKKPL